MRILRTETTYAVYFAVHEGLSYEDGSARASIRAEAVRPSIHSGKRAQVSWPATTDKRPELARALAEVLTLAADEADGMNDALEQHLYRVTTGQDPAAAARALMRLDTWKDEELARYGTRKLVVLARIARRDGDSQFAGRLIALAGVDPEATP